MWIINCCCYSMICCCFHCSCFFSYVVNHTLLLPINNWLHPLFKFILICCKPYILITCPTFFCFYCSCFYSHLVNTLLLWNSITLLPIVYKCFLEFCVVFFYTTNLLELWGMCGKQGQTMKMFFARMVHILEQASRCVKVNV